MRLQTMTYTDFFKKIFLVIFLLLIVGCDSNNQIDITAQPSLDNKSIVSGGVTKGVLVGATVKAYNIAIDGTIDYSNLVASALTDNNGLFNLELPADRGYLLLESSSGEFIDETDQNPNIAEKRKIVFSESEGLSTVLPPTYSAVALTIISQSIYEKSKNEFDGDFYSIYLTNITKFEIGLGFNPLSTLSADPVSPDQNASASAKLYALIAGGLANIANQLAIELGYPIPTYDVIKAVITDFSDGNIDGMVSGVPVRVGGVSIPTDLDLDNAIMRFRNNNFANFESTALPQINYAVMEVSANPFPVVRAGVDQTVDELALVQLNGAARVAGGIIESTIWTQTQGVAVVLSDDFILDPTFISPSVDSDTPLVFQLTATDNNGVARDSSVTITVHANIPPEVSAGSEQNVDEQTTVSLNGTAIDSDGSIVSIVWTQTHGTDVDLSNANTLSPSFIAPSISSDETLVFELSATDNINDSSVSSVVINVRANRAPDVSAGSDQIVDPLSTVNLSGSVTDSDGSIVSTLWRQIQGTTVALSDTEILTPSFTSPSIIDGDEILIFQLSATDDDGDEAVSNVSITVHENIAPVVNAGADQTVNEQAQVNLSASVSDSDGSIISLIWAQTQGTAVSLSDTNILNPTFISPSITTDETLIFELSAIDDKGAIGIDSVSVNLHANIAPVISAGSDQTVDEKTLVNLAGTASDSDGTIASISWTQTLGTSVTLSDVNILSPSFTAPDISSNQSVTFELTVIDNLDDVSTDLVTINIVANIAPTISMPAAQTVGAVLPVQLTATGNDSDGTIVSYQWTQVSGPAVILSNANSQTASFVSPTTTIPASTSFSLTVTDNDGDTATATTSVTTIPVLVSSLTFSDGSLAACVTNHASINGYLYVHQFVDLSCDTTSITDLTGLSALESMNDLALFTGSTPSLSNISGLAGLKYVTSLNLSGNMITDITPLNGMTALTSLNLNNNNISNLSALSGMTSLADLTLNSNSVTNLAPLSGLTSITKLWLPSNSISDISFLSGLTAIKNLQLQNNSISNVTALTGLTALKSLQMENNSISDISSLSGLTALTTLNFNNNSISNILSLSGMILLDSLNLEANAITDVTPLAGMADITYLSLDDNGTLAVFTTIESLTSLLTLNIQNTAADCGDLMPLQVALSTTTILESVGSCP